MGITLTVESLSGLISLSTHTPRYIMLNFSRASTEQCNWSVIRGGDCRELHMYRHCIYARIHARQINIMQHNIRYSCQRCATSHGAHSEVHQKLRFSCTVT